jgi:hypothetical protein
MPGLIPTSPDDPASEPNRAAWKVLSDSATPMLDAGEELAAAIVQFLSRPL